MKRSLGLLVMLVALVGLAAAVGSLPEPSAADRVSVLGDAVPAPPRGLRDLALGLGVLVLGAWIFGEVLSVVKLPRICGYLLFGVVVGPESAAWRPLWFPQILDAEQMSYLKLVDGIAIAVIAFVAGGEIRLGELLKVIRKVAVVVAFHAGLVMPGMALAAAFLILPRIPEFAADEGNAILLGSLVLGTIAMAISPAVLIAVIKDARARGPVTQASLTTAILVDLVLIVTFTAIMFAAVTFLGGESAAPADGGLAPLLGGLAWHLLGSVLVGGVLGAIVLWVSRGIPDQLDALVLLAAFGIAVIGEVLHVAPLLVGLTAGIAQANLKGHNANLEKSAERLLLPVCCVFFAVAGAGVHLEALPLLWPTVLLVVGCRAALVATAATISTRLAKFEGAPRRWLWASFISQAGLSIALVGEARRNFADAPWMIELSTLLLAVIAIHELAGPLLMRLGLARSGEVGAADRPDAEPSVPSEAAAANPEPAR